MRAAHVDGITRRGHLNPAKGTAYELNRVLRYSNRPDVKWTRIQKRKSDDWGNSLTGGVSTAMT